MQVFILATLFITNLVFSDTSISVNQHIVVSSNAQAVYLKDLFAKNDLEKFNKKILKKLSSTVLASKIKAGEKLEFSSTMISKIMRKVNRQDNIKIVIPQTVVLIHESDVLNEENIKLKLSELWMQDCEDCVFKFLNIEIPEVKAKSWSLDSYRKLPRGYFTQAIRIILEDGSEKIRWAKGKVEIYKKTPVLTRSVAIGERLVESDLKMQLKNITYHYSPIANINALIGSKTRRYMSENQIVWLTDVDIQKSVKRGDVIRIKKLGNAWQMSTAGVAEQDGVIGDVIRVRGQNNRKLFSAKVIGDREVELQ